MYSCLRYTRLEQEIGVLFRDDDLEKVLDECPKLSLLEDKLLQRSVLVHQ